MSALALVPDPEPEFTSPIADPLLALSADVLDDLETVRIANENRLRQLTRVGLDKDGGERGFGLDPAHPDVVRLAALVEFLKKAENDAIRNLTTVLKRSPMHPWIAAQKGIGDKQAARLLAAIGDPYLNLSTGEPRRVSDLWSYCGHGDPLRRKKKGMTQEEAFALGNPTAKMRVWGIANSCLKAGGPWAEVYRDRREVTKLRTHATACVRCGPSGKPAEPGSDWPPAHQHADALRVLGKKILQAMWIEAKRIHDAT